MYQNYLLDEQLNFQVNRFIEPYYEDRRVQDEVKKACSRISSLSSWYANWVKLAEIASQRKDYEIAATYYELALFFLNQDDPSYLTTYQAFIQNFYKGVDKSKIEMDKVPYEGGTLPVAIIRQQNAKGWLIYSGGFDSYLEELIRLSMTYLVGQIPYNILVFEGPGQGSTSQQGLHLTYQWEKPITALLNYYKLDDVVLLGMSLGGYLVMRAAAFEKRVRKVICFDTFFSMMDSLTKRMSASQISQLQNLLKTNQFNEQINDEFKKIGQQSIDMHFKLAKAAELLGLEEPVAILKAIEHYTLEGIEDKITQDILLLAGNEDVYVPTYRTGYLPERLTNVSGLESALFTAQQGGQYHCQVGNKKIAFAKIKEFLAEN